MKLYGIWCKDLNNNNGDWLRELPSKVNEGGEAILAFTSIQAARARAADHYHYQSYTRVAKDDWAEVVLLNDAGPERK